jgi:hypothetical protein
MLPAMLRRSERRNSPTGTKTVSCCQFYRASFVMIGKSTEQVKHCKHPTL